MTQLDPSLADATQEIPAALVKEPSIVDTILDLDAFLSGDVRLAEKTARFCIEPDLEAEIDDLEHQLALLVDAGGRPLSGTDEALADDQVSRPLELATKLQELRHRYAAAMRSVRMRQIPDDDWQAFKVLHREAFSTPEPTDERKVMLDELLIRTAHTPPISAEQLAKLRHRVGSPQVDELLDVAWTVNTKSGVSVPKSPLSSAVLKRLAPGPS